MEEDEDVNQLIRSGQQRISGRLTGKGDVQGTPFYMSPEQATETGDVDERTDIYNMGIILFEVLTCESYMSGRNFKEIKRKILEDPVREPRRVAPKRRVPPELSAICVRALQKEPKDRYQKMAEMVDDLRNALLGKPVSVYSEPAVFKLLKWRESKVLSMASVFWMVLGALFCIIFQQLWLLGVSR
jgi:serine/threonine protein kinase